MASGSLVSRGLSQRVDIHKGAFAPNFPSVTLRVTSAASCVGICDRAFARNRRRRGSSHHLGARDPDTLISAMKRPYRSRCLVTHRVTLADPRFVDICDDASEPEPLPRDSSHHFSPIRYVDICDEAFVPDQCLMTHRVILAGPGRLTSAMKHSYRTRCLVAHRATQPALVR